MTDIPSREEVIELQRQAGQLNGRIAVSKIKEKFPGDDKMIAGRIRTTIEIMRHLADVRDVQTMHDLWYIETLEEALAALESKLD